MDIQTIVTDLLSHGFTQAELSEVADDYGQSSISKIKRGDLKRPPYPVYINLLNLHTETFKATE